MAMRDLRNLSAPPQVVHFIPIHATPRPAMDTMMPTIIKARVACSEPSETYVRQGENRYLNIKFHFFGWNAGSGGKNVFMEGLALGTDEGAQVQQGGFMCVSYIHTWPF